MRKIAAAALAAGVLLAAFTGRESFAQSKTGNIRGVVTDSSRALLPGVEIWLTHVQTRETFRTVTDEAGAYKLDVPLGTYTLTGGVPGFVPLNLRVTFNEDQPLLLNLTLRVDGSGRPPGPPLEPYHPSPNGPRWVPLDQ